MRQKLELTAVGYVFSIMNIYLTLNDKPLPGIVFGVIACGFFIQALRIKEK